MRNSRRVLLAAIAVIGALGIGAVLLHSPEFHEHMARLHGSVPIHGGGPAATLVGDSGGSAAANALAREGVAEIGRRWDAAAFAQTVSLYTAVHREIEWPGVLEPETIQYGPDAAQSFDVFRPEQEFSEPGPVFVFLHGNGLGDSDRLAAGSEGLIYSHLGRLAATAGGIGISMSYRTRAPLDAGATDLRRVIEWIGDNIEAYGGDSGTIVVLGNAEGATTLAAYLFSEARQTASGPKIAAAMLSSGPVDVLEPEIRTLISGYGGERVPLALWMGEYDTPDVTEGMLALHEQLCEKYADCPALERIPGHNRVSHIMSLGTADTDVMNRFIRFYHTVR